MTPTVALGSGLLALQAPARCPRRGQSRAGMTRVQPADSAPHLWA